MHSMKREDKYDYPVSGYKAVKMVVGEWLNASFEGGRHQTRIDMIHEIEETQNLKEAEEI